MTRPYRLAFIGGSIESIAGYPHAVAARMDHRFSIDAGAFSTQPAVNRATAAAWGVERLYDDWRAMLDAERGRIDAVVILLPTPLHAEALAAVRAQSIPAVCEKPLVATPDEMASFRADFDPQREFVVVTNNYSGYQMVRELRQRIRDGELGAIHAVQVDMPQESFLRPPKSVKYPQPWRLSDGPVPMISLDLGTHCYHLADFLLAQRPDRVWCDQSRISKYGVIDDVRIRCRYPSGASGDLWLSKVALGHRNGLAVAVHGDRAAATWVQAEPELLRIAYPDGTRRTLDRGGEMHLQQPRHYNRMTPGHPSGFIEAFANLYADIADSLDRFRRGEPYITDYCYGVDQAHESLSFFADARRAADTGLWLER